MAKKAKIGFVITFFLLPVIFAAGCGTQKGGNDPMNPNFVKGPDGLVMEFVKNNPLDRYIVSSNAGESVSVVVEIKNKGTYPESLSANSFSGSRIFISGFDEKIINFGVGGTSKVLSSLALPGVSSTNLLGGLDTVPFSGDIDPSMIKVDNYEPTILATMCYDYFTKASPAVCVDPRPFDDRQQKVCTVGSQTLSTQGAPIAITKIDQEAATDRIRFKISIKNVGKADVLKSNAACDAPNRNDLDRVKVEKIKISTVDLFNRDADGTPYNNGNCGPFADNTLGMIRLVNGEGFIICTLETKEMVQSAYTTPLNIELSYKYRSTISKNIKISKLN